jgi:hypothetical protein
MKWQVKFLYEGTEYAMVVQTSFKHEANKLAKTMVRKIDGIDIEPIGEPTLWTEKE